MTYSQLTVASQPYVDGVINCLSHLVATSSTVELQH